MTTPAAISLFAFVLHVALFVVVLNHGLTKNRQILAFSAYLLAMGLTQLGYIGISFARSAAQALSWYTFMIPVAAGPPVLFLLFTRTFLKLKTSRTMILIVIAAWVVPLLFEIAFRRSAIFVAIHRDGTTGLFVPEFGPIALLLFAPVLYFWALSAFSLLRRRRGTKSPLERVRIQYLLAGVVLVGAGMTANLSPALRPYPLDVACDAMSALVIAYAILRYQLLDIQLFFRKALLYTVSTIANGAISFLIISLAFRFFRIVGESQVLLLALSVALVSTALAWPLRERTRRLIERMFFRETYDGGVMVQKLIRFAASTLDLDRLLHMILDEVTETMHIQNAAFLLSADGDGFRLAAQRGLTEGSRVRLEYNHPVVELLRRRGTPLTVDDLQGQPGAATDLASVELLVPLLSMGKLVGVLAVGPKQSQKAYVPEEILLLRTLADQTAVAVQNALLYETVQRQLAEQKVAEREKSRLQEQLAQSHKLESVGRLAGGVAHDFNNMLGVILGQTDLGLAQIGETQPLHDNLEEIRKAAERSANLTRQLLAFARKQTVAPKVLDLNATISDMLTMLDPLLGEKVTLAWSPREGLWPVKIDPSQIDQILTNLCVNARDAVEAAGTITIDAVNVVMDASTHDAHPDVPAGEYVRLAVSDDGCGMDEETLSNVFEPFFTTKGVGEGTGLGLATVYGIVKQNDGFIEIASAPRQGTVCGIYLPRYRGQVTPARTEEAERAVEGGNETILLVEDERAILNMIRLVLQKNGYAVLSAGTPGEALEIARRHAEDICLLITDVVMPAMNGSDLAQAVRALHPEIKSLFMSGYTADIIADHGVVDEAVHFIPKPFSMRSLAKMVRSVLDGTVDR